MKDREINFQRRVTCRFKEALKKLNLSPMEANGHNRPIKEKRHLFKD